MSGENRTSQLTIVEAVAEILRVDHRVLGVSVFGSVAAETSDRYSDIDMNCWLRDDAKTGRAELYERVGSILPLICKLWIWDRHALYLFTDGARLDLDFLRPDEIRQADHQTHKILHDPAGALFAGFASQAPLNAPNPLAHFSSIDGLMDWFFWMARQTAGWSGRGETSPIRRYDKCAGAIDSLAQARARTIEMRLAMHGRWDYLERVDPSLAEELAETYPHRFDAASIQRANLQLLRITERVARDYCRFQNAQFPAEKFAAVYDILESFESGIAEAG
jgi:hypothetical protein